MSQSSSPVRVPQTFAPFSLHHRPTAGHRLRAARYRADGTLDAIVDLTIHCLADVFESSLSAQFPLPHRRSRRRRWASLSVIVIVCLAMIAVFQALLSSNFPTDRRTNPVW